MTIRAILVIIVLLGAPLIPLCKTWARLLGSTKTEGRPSLMRVRTGAIVTSASFALLLVGLVWTPALGLDYTTRRFITIYANLGLMVAVAIVAAFGSRPYRLLLTASSLLVALEWAYLAVVSSVV
jgi:hypothetical protein